MSKRKRKGVHQADWTSRLLHWLVFVHVIILIAAELIDGAEFIKYKYQRAFPPQHPTASSTRKPGRHHNPALPHKKRKHLPAPHASR
jgi:hypothetical protein